MIPCNILAKTVNLEINGEPFYLKQLNNKIQREKNCLSSNQLAETDKVVSFYRLLEIIGEPLTTNG